MRIHRLQLHPPRPRDARRRPRRQSRQADVRREPGEPGRPRQRFAVHVRAGRRLRRAGRARRHPGGRRRRQLAAESHVDRSLMEPDAFLRTDVFGVFTLLEAVKELKIARFLHISTDEVYGSVERGSSRESDPVRPSNPYSASKAGGDLLALAYWHTHRVPVLITRSSNNFGPCQYPEKVIPLFITNALEDRPLPLYGDGRNVRDWI